ncbi:hypothetical protein PBY51_017653 [Eleginops maclovinus]|uniref:Uncharacterized protein n=1 Tax=Eleginops maclovinus TaxID=56733 RepID=A0AAN7XK37_ELEMC|nr:hypothetical protein PBY51_017653 [Eleginops maclovinus]
MASPRAGSLQHIQAKENDEDVICLELDCAPNITHNVMRYTCVLEDVVLLSLIFIVSPHSEGVHRWWAEKHLQPHTSRPIIGVSSSEADMTSM